MTGKHTIFSISKAFWPSIYEGDRFAPGEKPIFGMTILGEEVPLDLRPYAKPTISSGVAMVQLRSKVRPRVIVIGGDVAHIFQHARDANMSLDLLLRDLPMDLSVEHRTFESTGVGKYAPGDTVDMLALVAVRVEMSGIQRRYDDLRDEYFSLE